MPGRCRFTIRETSTGRWQKEPGCEGRGGAWHEAGAGRGRGDSCCWNLPRTQKRCWVLMATASFKPLRNPARSAVPPFFFVRETQGK